MPDTVALDPLARLVGGVRLLSLDAGNTIVFLDHARVAAIVRPAGMEVDAARLVETEGEAKRLLGTAGVRSFPFDAATPSNAGWASVLGTMLASAGAAPSAIPRALSLLWASHVERNLWSVVPGDLAPALLALREGGVKIVVVSNSEGMLLRLFESLGIAPLFDAIVDSGVAGVEKPDPRIFDLALAPHGVPPSLALHLGDTVATDVEGARAAGLRFALLDPHRHYEGLFPDVLRVTSVAEVARALLAGSPGPRSGRSS